MTEAYVTFNTRLAGFLAAVNEMRAKYWAASKYTGSAPVVYVDRFYQGTRYLRLNTEGSVYAFIDLSNGDILKPGSYKAVAKNGKRGSIHAEDFGLSCASVYGLKYLR